jgi:hypothetical protein
VAGYNPLLSRLAPLGKTALLTLYLQAYPGAGDTTGDLSRDVLLARLLDHADSHWRARQWLDTQTRKGGPE